MRRQTLLGVTLAASMMSAGMIVRSEADAIAEPEDRPPPPRLPHPRAAEPKHKHAREIARRLRQQARAEAKRAGQ